MDVSLRVCVCVCVCVKPTSHIVRQSRGVSRLRGSGSVGNLITGLPFPYQ